ncbi:MAG: VacJ family lipoprotein, partial [Pseudomonadota bacterium]|nr:VacJ family lipoprotein [Pseudomonadota bacterium]
MSMLRFIMGCALASSTIGLAYAESTAPEKKRFSLPELPKIPDAVQQLRVDATASQPDDIKDPFEGFNRRVFRFNDYLDRNILLPTAKAYQKVVPKPVNTSVSHFFSNLKEPWTATNQLLQGKPKESLRSLGRFTVNTLTSLGFADAAQASLSLRRGDEDFGQTLGVWGVKSGPFIMLPLLGPSTVRDTGAMAVDMFARPTRYIDEHRAEAILLGLNIVDTRANLIGVESLIRGDQYPVLRDVYLQRRLQQVFDGNIPARFNPPIEEGFGDEDFDEQGFGDAPVDGDSFGDESTTPIDTTPDPRKDDPQPTPPLTSTPIISSASTPTDSVDADTMDAT